MHSHIDSGGSVMFVVGVSLQQGDDGESSEGESPGGAVPATGWPGEG